MNRLLRYVIVFMSGVLLGILIDKPDFLTDIDLSYIGDISTLSGIDLVTITSIFVLLGVWSFNLIKKNIPFRFLYLLPRYRRKYLRKISHINDNLHFKYSCSIYSMERLLAKQSATNSSYNSFTYNFFTLSSNYSISKEEVVRVYTKASRIVSVPKRDQNQLSNQINKILFDNLNNLQANNLNISQLMLLHYNILILYGITLDKGVLIRIWQTIIYSISEFSANKSHAIITFDEQGIIDLPLVKLNSVIDRFKSFLDHSQKEELDKIISKNNHCTAIHKLYIIENKFLFNTEEI